MGTRRSGAPRQESAAQVVSETRSQPSRPGSPAAPDAALAVCRPSTVKRARRTRAQLAELDAAIIAAVEQEQPVTLRGVYYRVVIAGAVEKTENAYRQIIDWQRPTRPTKRTDTRSASFHGGSVEVDAVPAPLLRQLVEDAITGHLDPHIYRLTLAVESEERIRLFALAGEWSQ